MKSNTTTTDYPNFLKNITNIADRPKRLCYAGTLPAHALPAVAIVGTRKPSTYGKEIAYTFAHSLAAQGITVVSGLALGIDSIAHRAALDANGTTVAVLPGPLTAIYPRSHSNLAKEIVTKTAFYLPNTSLTTPYTK